MSIENSRDPSRDLTIHVVSGSIAADDIIATSEITFITRDHPYSPSGTCLNLSFLKSHRKEFYN